MHTFYIHQCSSDRPAFPVEAVFENGERIQLWHMYSAIGFERGHPHQQVLLARVADHTLVALGLPALHSLLELQYNPHHVYNNIGKDDEARGKTTECVTANWNILMSTMTDVCDDGVGQVLQTVNDDSVLVQDAASSDKHQFILSFLDALLDGADASVA